MAHPRPRATSHRRTHLRPARRGKGRLRRALPAGLVASLLTAPAVPAGAPSLAAQPTLAEATATPESTAELFLRSLRAIRWETAARFLHPATLERFRYVVTSIAEADTTGDVRETLTGTTDAAAYARLSPEEVFERSIGTMIDSMPGLMHAIFDRDDRVVGHVAESADSAHVVYRTTPRISGAVSEVNVMQLTRTDAGWRVQWSDELQVLDTALRGFARPTRPPPPPPPGEGAPPETTGGPGEEASPGSRPGPEPDGVP